MLPLCMYVCCSSALHSHLMQPPHLEDKDIIIIIMAVHVLLPLSLSSPFSPLSPSPLPTILHHQLLLLLCISSQWPLTHTHTHTTPQTHTHHHHDKTKPILVLWPCPRNPHHPHHRLPCPFLRRRPFQSKQMDAREPLRRPRTHSNPPRHNNIIWQWTQWCRFPGDDAYWCA